MPLKIMGSQHIPNMIFRILIRKFHTIIPVHELKINIDKVIRTCLSETKLFMSNIVLHCLNLHFRVLHVIYLP